jgi:hypothetical protein
VSQSEIEQRISGAFINNESIANKETDNLNKALRGLREYFDNKFGK